MVNEPFLTRCGISCCHLYRRALFHIQVWGIVPLEIVNCNDLSESSQTLFYAKRRNFF